MNLSISRGSTVRVDVLRVISFARQQWQTAQEWHAGFGNSSESQGIPSAKTRFGYIISASGTRFIETRFSGKWFGYWICPCDRYAFDTRVKIPSETGGKARVRFITLSGGRLGSLA